MFAEHVPCADTVLDAGGTGVVPASWSAEFGEGGGIYEKIAQEDWQTLLVPHSVPSALTFAVHTIAS